ncbi:MAG: helix-hairpin-helix domain-containing protein [Bacteroidota bacterium]
MENPLEFSKRSRKAILFFVLFFLLIVITPRIIFLFREPSDFKFTQTDFEKKVFKKRTFSYSNNYTSYSKKSKFKTPPKKFDPNEYSPSDWMNLGMSQKQADLIIRFGKRGFYSDEDLKKVFVISDKFFAVIKDSLFYPERKVFEKTTYTKEVKTIKIIELNTASEEELMTIKGIGQFFAKNIIKQRNALGGFISKKQLLEVWKMDEEKLSLLDEFISVDPNLIKQINLNSVTAEELKKHPYFTWNIANSIVKLRAQIGSYQKIEDIKRSVLVDEEFYNKIKPYLSL